WIDLPGLCTVVGLYLCQSLQRGLVTDRARLLYEGHQGQFERVILDSHPACKSQGLQGMQLVETALGLDVLERQFVGRYGKGAGRNETQEQRCESMHGLFLRENLEFPMMHCLCRLYQSAH